MDRLTAMQVFVRVVETGSFSKAASELGTTQPTATKAVAEAEGRLTLAEAWPTARNPFAGALRPSPFVPLEQCSRRVCCLRYLLPGWADCGSFCPLPARSRATGTADSPADET